MWLCSSYHISFAGTSPWVAVKGNTEFRINRLTCKVVSSASWINFWLTNPYLPWQVSKIFAGNILLFSKTFKKPLRFFFSPEFIKGFNVIIFSIFVCSSLPLNLPESQYELIRIIPCTTFLNLFFFPLAITQEHISFNAMWQCFGESAFKPYFLTVILLFHPHFPKSIVCLQETTVGLCY